MNIPLLTIVPIPYIAIQTIDIAFKANINASSSSSTVENESSSVDAGLAGSTSLNMGIFKINADFHANYSSKKDSTATQDSKYSVEYTMDVAVKAGQDSMPAGLAKVLELLGNSLDVCDPSGTLEVNALEFKGSPSETFMLIATYKNREGLFEPEKIQIPGQTGTVDGNNMLFNLPVVEGKTTSYIVGVSGIDKKVIVKTTDSYTEQRDRELARIEREENDKKRMAALQASLSERRKTLNEERAKELAASQERIRKIEEKQAKEESLKNQGSGK